MTRKKAPAKKSKRYINPVSWRDRPPLPVRDASEGMPKKPIPYNHELARAELGLSERPRYIPTTLEGIAMHEHLEEERVRGEVFDILLKRLEPPSEKELKGKFFSRFRTWCVTKGFNPDRETTGGRHFQDYLRELREEAEKKKRRAEKVRRLFKVQGRMWTSREAVEEDEENNGWNQCLFRYIENGSIPEEKPLNPQEGNPHIRGQATGWNRARRELQKMRI